MPKRPAINYETLSPFMILRFLPSLAYGKVEQKIAVACGLSTPPAWQLFEEGVFLFFRTILMLNTIKLGNACLFKADPEGIVLVNRGSSPFSLIYECKSRSAGYKMSSNDVLRYKKYIRDKRYEIQVKHNLNLTHFVIISSDFKGDFSSKIEDIETEGTVVSLCRAQLLTDSYNTFRELDVPALLLFDIRKLFCRGYISDEHVKACLELLPKI
jgi:hypothetical protein